MYDFTKSAVLLEGENPQYIGQGWQGCGMSPFLLSDQLLDEVEKAGIGITRMIRLGV